jgi:hypothetical protein
VLHQNQAKIARHSVKFLSMNIEFRLPPIVENFLGWIAGIAIIVCAVILWDASRKNPPVKPQPKSETLNIFSMMDMCKELVSKQLKAPSTATYTDSSKPIGLSDLVWNSFVDAENSFGAKIRTNFACTYTKNTDTVRAVLKN